MSGQRACREWKGRPFEKGKSSAKSNILYTQVPVPVCNMTKSDYFSYKRARW